MRTPDLTSIFKLSIYLLTAFVGVVLGAAEWGWIPFVSVPITLLGYWWCEIAGGSPRPVARGLTERASIVLGVMALAAAAIEFFSDNPEGKLLSGIHLVVYLTWIVLLQRKHVVRYWQLLVLGVLQVAVASVLTNGTWFGLCVIGYLMAATWTMSVFSLYRAAEQFADDKRHAAEPTDSDATHADSILTSQAIPSVCAEEGAEWVSPRFIAGVALSSGLGLCVGAAFFIFTPRVWVGTSFGLADEELPPTLRATITGLATEVRLDDMRQVLESNDPVLTLRVFHDQTNQPLDALNYADRLGLPAPLFRGAILTSYESGRWRPYRQATDFQERLFAHPDSATTTAETVRQEIKLEPIGNDILFCLGLPLAMRDAENYRCGNRQILNDIAIRRTWFKELSGPVNYIAYTELPQRGSRGDGSHVPLKARMPTYRFTNYFPRCSEVPESLERLIAHARQVVEAEQQRLGRSVTEREQARALESHLRDSRRYRYSLAFAQVDPKLDPVEDFLFNSQAGHCQYFASALCLMLRAVGIPARVVTGFQGGERQPDGSLLVEKRFAHAWVEAWIDDERWITLDATPEDERDASVTEVGTQRSLWTAVSSRLAQIWEYNVLNISLDRQEELYYGPLRELGMAIWRRVTEFLTSPLTSLIGLATWVLDPRNWLTLPGVLLLTTLCGLFYLLRRVRSRLGLGWWNARHDPMAASARRIEFYERFVRLMQAHGHARRPAQTQGEFVHDVAGSLALMQADATLTQRLIPVSDLFYRVRFGDEELPPQEVMRLNELLADLEQSLGPKPKSHGHRG